MSRRGGGITEIHRLDKAFFQWICRTQILSSIIGLVHVELVCWEFCLSRIEIRIFTENFGMLPTVYGSSVLKWSLGPKKILDRKFLGGRKKFGQKDFGSKKFYGRKFLWVWKFFLKVEKMYQVKKDSGQKKFSCQKNSLGRKKFSGQKNFQVKKIFRSKKISWLKKLWGWVVIIRVKVISVQSIEIELDWLGLSLATEQTQIKRVVTSSLLAKFEYEIIFSQK